MNDYLNSLFSLEGKRAVVIGAGRGLGQGLAVSLARVGAEVVLCARSTEQLEETAALVRSHGGTARIHTIDVSDADAVQRLFDEVGSVDVVVNAAAIIERADAVDLDLAAWHRMIGINLSGAYYVARAAAKSMLKHGIRGSIIQIGSVQATTVLRQRVAYTASKGGIVQMVKSFAYELGEHGIRVNALLPGFFRTAINDDLFQGSDWFDEFVKHVPSGEPGRAEELEAALLYLASPASSYTTGTTVVVDGGLTAGIPL